MGVPAPDNISSFPDKGFDFTRLGIRVPTLLISPWVPKGTVIKQPLPSEKPQPNSEFDLTSIISTVKNIFGAPNFLTRRDAWAATFDGRLSEPQPRTDCPLRLPDSPKSLGFAHAAREAALPLNHLQRDIVNAFATLRGPRGAEAEADVPVLPVLQGEASEWMERVVAEVLEGKHAFAGKF